MNDWWQNRQPRERQTLIAGAIILAVMFYYFLIWQPAQQGVASKQERLSQLREDATWMEQAAERYQELSEGQANTATASTDEALYALADRTAREAGLGDAIQGITPEAEDRVRVNLRGTGFDGLIPWLGRLRKEFGVRTASASVERAEKPGQVHAQLVLQRGTQ